MYPAFLTPLLFFLAFLLLLLVSLSVPITKTIFLFRLTSNISSGLVKSSVSGSATFGVWGYCVSAIEVSIAAFDDSSSAFCSSAKLGYTFDQNVAKALYVLQVCSMHPFKVITISQVDDFTDLISRTTAAALVLHPVACGLSFLALLVSLFMLRRGDNGGISRVVSLLTLGAGLLSAILTTIVFLIDVIMVAVIRNKVHDHSDGDLEMNWGNAVWMALGATIALWLAMAGSCAGICACGTRYRNRKDGKY
ncbi:actin cortical patch SUR7/pH-response regulator pali [Mucidula mucida]|nr:actin cortical patch SUR7/pH-response regulator pali [Mucidula mucida]